MLPGLNHNIPYQGKVFHVQTEDSGREHPHIITHVFIEGQIIASRKSDYRDRLREADLDAVVKLLMQEQHKDVIRALIHGRLPGAMRPPAPAIPVATRPVARATVPPRALVTPAQTRPVAPVKPAAPPASKASRAGGSPFGKDLVSNRSLDEVILQFIADEIARSDKGEGKK